MEHHLNQNGFTWKRMKPTVCIIAQYKSVTMVDFKVREGAESMLIPSTVGSFILTKSPIQVERSAKSSGKFSSEEHK